MALNASPFERCRDLAIEMAPVPRLVNRLGEHDAERDAELRLDGEPGATEPAVEDVARTELVGEDTPGLTAGPELGEDRCVDDDVVLDDDQVVQP